MQKIFKIYFRPYFIIHIYFHVWTSRKPIQEPEIPSTAESVGCLNMRRHLENSSVAPASFIRRCFSQTISIPSYELLGVSCFVRYFGRAFNNLRVGDGSELRSLTVYSLLFQGLPGHDGRSRRTKGRIPVRRRSGSREASLDCWASSLLFRDGMPP